MYKPRQNSNRVKSIKNKFENIENQQNATSKITKASLVTGESLGNNNVLTRQFSDPLKPNIKRTPAFRLDINSEKAIETLSVQRNNLNQKTLFETKVKQFTSVKQSFNCDEYTSNNTDLQYLGNSIKNCDVSDRSLSECLVKQNPSFLHSSNNSDIRSNNNLTDPHCLWNNSILEPIKTDPQEFAPRATSSKTPILIKSKSSHDFKYIRSKFNKESILPNSDALKLPTTFNESVIGYKQVNCLSDDNQSSEITEKITSEEKLPKNVDLSLVYTEPIPKSLRYKNSSESSTSNESPLFKPKIESIYTKSTLKLTDTNKKKFLESLTNILKQDLPGGITDSLKVALKKPLPDGPAPKKPPRTFQHCPESVIASNIKKNISFLHTSSKKNGKKGDPKYMLNKLETALKNNKLRSRKQKKVEVSTTSGEDSDDSLLFRSKSCRSLPKPPLEFQDFKESESAVNSRASPSKLHLLGDLGCLMHFGCAQPTYEKLKEPNSSFFVGVDHNPIYAEPVQRKPDGIGVGTAKNTLCYMSTALILEDTGQNSELVVPESTSLHDSETKMDDLKEDPGTSALNRQLSAEDSSLSSFTSDLDSNPSPVTDDTHAKIRYLIENFEARRQTFPKVERELSRDSQDRCSDPPDCSNRVELLKISIRKTLDNSFKSDVRLTNPRDSDSEINEEGKVARMVARFHTFQKTAPKYQQPQINIDTLFYCCLVIEKVQDYAQIKLKYPPNVDIPRDIENLCFPESPNSPPLEGCSAAQTYTLLVTSETGDRTYGYCRRVLPEGSTHCLPLAYCILSKYKSHRFYKRILIELESRHGIQNKFRDELISQFYYKKFPRPGESITINLSSIEDRRPRNPVLNGLEESVDLTNYIQDTTTELILTLNPDPRYEDADLKKLHKLPPDILLKIFSSLLLERKVILISSVISELSSCVDSLQSILYPFTWYHTFIPILPESLWDIVESPTPVVCGVLSQDAIKDRYIENGMVVDLDTRTVLVEEGDEMKILSGSLQKVWRQFITLANNTKSREYVYSVYLADAYLYVFICCFKHYKQYIVNGTFLKDKLVSDAETKGKRRFLKMFTETCMFHAFMDVALNNPESLVAFDKKIELYGSNESRVILNKLIDWHR